MKEKDIYRKVEIESGEYYCPLVTFSGDVHMIIDRMNDCVAAEVLQR